MLTRDADFIPNMRKFRELIGKFHELGVFNSINHSRVLTYLLASPKGRTAKEICSDLGLPNSKVYSALNSLETMGLIASSGDRPKKYLISSARDIEQFLDMFLQQEMKKKQLIVEEIHNLMNLLWTPEIPPLDQIAYIYKGRELQRQVVRMIASAQDRIFLLLGSQSANLLDVCMRSLEQVSSDIVVDAAFPEITCQIETILSHFRHMRLKQSIWNGNSYVVIDGRIMLSITHPHEVGLLTNDPLLVDHICNCWSDPRCCR